MLANKTNKKLLEYVFANLAQGNQRLDRDELMGSI